MGISDEDYANALEHQRLHAQALMKLELQNKQETLEQSIQKASTYTVSSFFPANVISTTTGTGSWENRTPLGVKTLNEQDLQHDAMKAPLSALLDMWTVRFSGEWVSETDLQEDDFWRLALIRLVGANKLEKHHLASQYAAVYRVIE